MDSSPCSWVLVYPYSPTSYPCSVSHWLPLQFSSSRIRHDYSSFNTDSLTNSHNYARAYSSSKLCKYIYLCSVCMSIYLSTYLSTYLVYLSLCIISPSSPSAIIKAKLAESHDLSVLEFLSCLTLIITIFYLVFLFPVFHLFQAFPPALKVNIVL